MDARARWRDDAPMPLDLTHADLATTATARRGVAHQEGERAKRMDNPGMRATPNAALALLRGQVEQVPPRYVEYGLAKQARSGLYTRGYKSNEKRKTPRSMLVTPASAGQSQRQPTLDAALNSHNRKYSFNEPITIFRLRRIRGKFHAPFHISTPVGNDVDVIRHTQLRKYPGVCYGHHILHAIFAIDLGK